MRIVAHLLLARCKGDAGDVWRRRCRGLAALAVRVWHAQPAVPAPRHLPGRVAERGPLDGRVGARPAARAAPRRGARGAGRGGGGEGASRAARGAERRRRAQAASGADGGRVVRRGRADSARWARDGGAAGGGGAALSPRGARKGGALRRRGARLGGEAGGGGVAAGGGGAGPGPRRGRAARGQRGRALGGGGVQRGGAGGVQGGRGGGRRGLAPQAAGADGGVGGVLLHRLRRLYDLRPPLRARLRPARRAPRRLPRLPLLGYLHTTTRLPALLCGRRSSRARLRLLQLVLALPRGGALAAPCLRLGHGPLQRVRLGVRLPLVQAAAQGQLARAIDLCGAHDGGLHHHAHEGLARDPVRSRGMRLRLAPRVRRR
mmetsp:Transcript_7517/g.21495  ORF Transcript_7517/g.21495 Transcript_7517/m.21495 type:complete len:375 (-) Transcript_7517:32-1156(-)